MPDMMFGYLMEPRPEYRPKHRRAVRWPDMVPTARCPHWSDRTGQGDCALVLCPKHRPANYPMAARHASFAFSKVRA